MVSNRSYPAISFLLISILTGCGGSGSSSDDVLVIAPSTQTPVQTPNPLPSETPTQDVPLISDVLDCVESPESKVGSGGEFKKVTLQSELAVCNDGSQAVMYVRAADTAGGSGNWNLHFQGGSSCSGADCAPRWCENSGRMSSLSTPDSSDFGGFLGRDADNLRADANQVFFYYCSSDKYTGQHSDVVIAETDDSPEFLIHFQGHNIIEHAMDVLETGATSDDQSVSLPSLGGDGTVTISGTSAGCMGVMNNADRIAQRVKSLGHETQVICDGSFGPDIPVLPQDERTEALVTLAQQVNQERNNNWLPRRDDSCEALQTEEPWRCDFASYVMTNHLSESPSFVRMDLGDPTISAGYLGVGFTMKEFATATRVGLMEMTSGIGLEQAPRPISVFGLVCGTHVGLLSGQQYYGTTINVDDSLLTLNQAIANWTSGQDIAAIDTIPPSQTLCP